MFITITKLKELIIDGLEITPKPNTNSIIIDDKEYKLKYSSLLSSVTKGVQASTLEVCNKRGRLKFTFIGSTGIVQEFSITHSTKSIAELVTK